LSESAKKKRLSPWWTSSVNPPPQELLGPGKQVSPSAIVLCQTTLALERLKPWRIATAPPPGAFFRMAPLITTVPSWGTASSLPVARTGGTSRT